MTSVPLSLSGCVVLVAEDNAIIAMDIQMMLEDRGASVFGPMATVDAALRAVAGGERIDYALLDIDLEGQASQPVIEALHKLGVPMVLITGHEVGGRLPPSHAALPIVDKPFTEADIIAALTRAMANANGGDR